jgi:HEAT repeat protein
MGAYLTSVAVAVAVISSLFGLMNYSHGNMLDALHAAVENMDQDELIEAAQSPQSKTRIDSILKLGEEPGDLAKTVPALAALTMERDELVRIAAGIALKNIGAPGLPHLKSLLESEDLNQVVIGCTAIREMDAGGKQYLPIFKKMLETGQSANRRRALFALQGVGTDSIELLDLIVDSLDDEDFNTKLMACRVLEKLGPDAIAAEKKLLQLLKEGLPSTRSWAARVLGAIGPTDKTDTAKLLADNLKAPLQVEKQRTLLGLCHLGAEANSQATAVRQLMFTTNQHVMPHAAYAYWKITGQTEEPLEVLKECLANPSYRDDAAEFIGKMGIEGSPLVDELAELLADPDPGTKEIAIVALGNVGVPAQKVMDQIRPLLKDNDPLVRYYAKTSIRQIEAADADRQQ